MAGEPVGLIVRAILGAAVGFGISVAALTALTVATFRVEADENAWASIYYVVLILGAAFGAAIRSRPRRSSP